jgi:hypothetical protein
VHIAVRHQAAAARPVARIHVTVAALLALFLVATVAAPSDARPHRVASAEHLAHRLVNCLRTGGKITRSGQCRGFGSGRYSKERKALALSHRISNRVSRPWAVRLIRSGGCHHGAARSSLDRRFRSVGLRAAANGENVACHSAMSPRRMVIHWMRYWYKETAWGGAHWRQIKDADFRSVGIGVVRRGDRTRLVVNFYGRVID